MLDKGIWEPERVGEHAEWADNQEFPAWLLTIGGARGYGHVQREAALFKILKQEI